MEQACRVGVNFTLGGATAEAWRPTEPPMDSDERSKAMEAAYRLLETPRAHLRVKFEQTEESVLLSYRDEALTGVALDSSGINAASAMAVALGVDVPASGESVEVLASTGLLYRVLAISDLDFNNPASFDLANHLVNEAIDMQRSARRAGSGGKPMELSELESGLDFGPYVIDLSQPESQGYIEATGDEVTPDAFGEHVHPLHLDAFVLSRLIEEIGIVENQIETVHAGQQMTVNKQVWPGDLIVANATLKSCSERRGSIWAIFETTFTDEIGDRVAVSSSTIIMMP